MTTRRILWTTVLTLALAVSADADFYVSPKGSDASPGTKGKPFATLERAREAVRARKPSIGEVTVWLRGGDYLRTNALEFSAADSGTAKAPVVWSAYRNERVRLLGGRLLAGFEPVTDAATLARLDEAARRHVLQIDLRRVGITNFGEMKSRGFARPTTPSHCELFFGQRPMTLARWPNEGASEKIAGFPKGSGKDDDHGGNIGDLPDGFLYAGDRPRRWRDTSDLWVHGYWAYDWANSYERVAKLDLDRRFILTAPPHGLYGFRAGQRFHFLNVLEELDQPGEWFLDRPNSLLYFWPPAPIASGETLLSLLDQPAIRMTDAAFLTVRGLVIEAARGSGVEINGGTGNRVEGCMLQNLGNLGVSINGGTDHGVAGCDIFDTGDGGVSLSGGDRETLKPGGHFVENCHFQRQGRWSKCYVPAVLMNGVGQRASHNLIHDHPHCAILFNGNDHLIEFNDVHHIALETGDVGAIYTGRDYSFRGNRIRHNYIHETGGVGMGSMGVYMDDCVSGTEVYGNVFYKVHWAMFIGGGRDHRVENNLFVDCDPAVRADGRGLDRSPVWRNMVNDYMRKQLAAVPAALYRERYPAMQSLDAFYGPPGGPAIRGDAFVGVPPEGNSIVRNICVGKWFDTGWNAKMDHFEVRDNFVTKDSNAVASAPGGFKLPKDSPAWKLGFRPIPFVRIGLRNDTVRRRLDGMRLASVNNPSPATAAGEPGERRRQRGPGTMVQWWLSSEDDAARLTSQPELQFQENPSPGRDVIRIDDATTYQQVLGLGSSFEHSTCYNFSLLPEARREKVIESIVHPERGIGMNLMRLCIGTSDFAPGPFYTYNDLPAGREDPKLERFSIERDREYVLPVIKTAQRLNPNLKFFASPWTPPPWMKTNGRYGGGRLRRECYPYFAEYLVRFIEAYRREGIEIHAITLQNEPEFGPEPYPSCLWTATEQRDFIRDHLGPLFRARGISTTVWTFDHNFNNPGFPATILRDPQAAQFIGGSAFHLYEGRPEAMSKLHRQFPDKPIYFTEGSVFGSQGAAEIISYFRNWAGSYNAWVTMIDHKGKPNVSGFHDCSPTIIVLNRDTLETEYRADYYLYGQFMKFIQPGAVRVGTTEPRKAPANVAFRNPDGSLVLVAANPQNSPRSLSVAWRGEVVSAVLGPKSVATLRWMPGQL